MVRVRELVLTGPVTVKVTELVEAFVYVWERALANVFDVEPSPKLQKLFVMVPVELFVKETVRGFRPLVGLVAAKLACGMAAPVPTTALELFPPLLANSTALVKLAALAGAKRTTRFVEPKPAKVNGVPDTIVKGPPATEAVPLVIAAPPRFVSAKAA